MSDFRIAVMGAGGRMGRELSRTVAAIPGCVLAGGIEAKGSKLVGQDLGAVAGLGDTGIKITDDPLELIARVDGILDFTVPAATVEFAGLAANARIVHVIGTTGLQPVHEAAIKAAARHATIVKAGNMSLGVNLLVALTKKVAEALDADFDIEVIEMHHKHKVDAPSGTALMLGQAAADGRAGGTNDGGDTVYRDFTWLSPAHRAANPWQGAVYGLEPYVMAGDTYSQAPYTGRGGWSWYTGAAAWMHRAAIESIFGLQISAASLHCTPCLPTHWPRADMHLRRDGRVMHFILWRGAPALALEAVAEPGAQLLLPGQALNWTELPPQSCHVIAWGQI